MVPISPLRNQLITQSSQPIIADGPVPLRKYIIDDGHLNEIASQIEDTYQMRMEMVRDQANVLNTSPSQLEP